MPKPNAKFCVKCIHVFVYKSPNLICCNLNKLSMIALRDSAIENMDSIPEKCPFILEHLISDKNGKDNHA